MPADIAQYTHRIGRTGRAGRKGIATTFVTGEGITETKGVLFDLRMMLSQCKQAVPPELERDEPDVPWPLLVAFVESFLESFLNANTVVALRAN